ncbi:MULTISPECIES: hypothetical protein [Bacteroidales]|uniref:Uncharacterized protein n=1 Tax=Parabacteroides distasonis TaxID=823 RepID=A0A3L7ZRI4_PARDI|nr:MULTISPECIES: hypothetical protein [Bacteroidales]NBH87916.1 hypothetical protein [Parabacteroides distasonis]RLT73901.1 hypothetical protein D7V78_07630 [Parabacteroides distasonis]TGY55022.1 hypothetical protein E5342_15650 [Parabacteroides distasonis]
MIIKDRHRNAFIVTAIIFLIGLAVGVYSLSRYTLVRFSVPLICFATVSLLSGVLLCKARIWGWITGSARFLPNFLCCSVCTCVFCLSVFYICNYAFANDKEGGMRDAVVEEKYQKVRHKSRRVGRNRYTRGEAYNVYYMKVRFVDGPVNELQIEQKRYARIHKGDTIQLFVSEGFFSVPVIKYNHVSMYTKGNRYRNQFEK